MKLLDKLKDKFKFVDQKELKKTKDKIYVTKPKEGYTWNPMLSFPRNEKCFCGSDIKAKKCCLPKMNRIVSIETAKQIRTNWGEFKHVFTYKGELDEDVK